MNPTDHLATINRAAVDTSVSRRPVTGRRLITATILLLLVALGIFDGIRSRVEAQARLHAAARISAVPMVEVVHPKSGADGQEVALPGNAQAFSDTPIYARTSGYVEHWYVDIGAHVKQGQLLAVIQTPELDQQLQQARADLKTAQANLEIAQITATRWQNLGSAECEMPRNDESLLWAYLGSASTVWTRSPSCLAVKSLPSMLVARLPWRSITTVGKECTR